MQRWTDPASANKFCKISDLDNEASVEQFFIIRLLSDLDYADRAIKPQKLLEEKIVAKGRKRERYRPDYLCYVDDRPRLVVDAKPPDATVDDFLYQVSGYALAINQEFEDENPVAFCLLSNGGVTKLYRWDKKKPLLTLSFEDFQDDNDKYSSLREKIGFKSIQNAIREIEQEQLFSFQKLDPREIVGLFKACHNIIRKSDKKSPSIAFYEFVKLMFIKLHEDRRLRRNPQILEMIEQGKDIPRDKVIFSLHWIRREEETEDNPVDAILFKNLREELEEEIESKRKKRIFDQNEKLKLKPSTIKKIVKILEHLDLFGVDDDLNGRLFETFLNATMRGKELGQFFTPRSVVKFMTKIAALKATQEHIDKVIDGFCGTAGFLIEAMTEMRDSIESNELLTNKQKETLLTDLKEQCLYGIDAGEAELPIARIARINMYLHQDGGSRIYQTDFLDKRLRIEKGTEKELRKDIQELKDRLLSENMKFDVALTNPPFAISLRRDERDEKAILADYEIAKIGDDGLPTGEVRTSLRSSVLSLERYYSLLKPHGHFLTIMDESILNTDSNEPFRLWLKRKFIIKAVISLPRNTFVNADSAVKTSILYLIKKEAEDESQPTVFMGISSNVGHSDVGKPTPNLEDLDSKIGQWFDRFQKGETNINFRDGETVCFAVSDLSNRTNRIDVHYFDPRYAETIKKLEESSKKEGMKLEPLGSLLAIDSKTKKPILTGGATPLGATYLAEGEGGVPFLRVQNIGKNCLDLSDVVYIPRTFHNGELKRSQLRPNDLLLTITGTYGMSAVVPPTLKEGNINQHSVRMQVDTQKIDAEYLSVFLCSPLCKRQMDRAVTGGTRPALDYPAIEALQILYPSDIECQREIARKVQEIVRSARERREEYDKLMQKIDEISMEELGQT